MRWAMLYSKSLIAAYLNQGMSLLDLTFPFSGNRDVSYKVTKCVTYYHI